MRYGSNVEHVQCACSIHTLSCVPAGAFRIELAKSDPASIAQKNVPKMAIPWLRLRLSQNLLRSPSCDFKYCFFEFCIHVLRVYRPLDSGTVFFAELFALPSRRPNSPKNHSNMTWKTRACLLAPMTFLFLARPATSQNFSALVHYSVTHIATWSISRHTVFCVPARAFTLDW